MRALTMRPQGPTVSRDEVWKTLGAKARQEMAVIRPDAAAEFPDRPEEISLIRRLLRKAFGTNIN